MIFTYSRFILWTACPCTYKPLMPLCLSELPWACNRSRIQSSLLC